MSFGGRITQLREMHKLTQAALSEMIPELTQSQLSRIEKGRVDIGRELMVYIAAETGVTPEFFHRPLQPGLIAHSPQFRARSRLTERVRNSAIQWANLVDECYQYLAGHTRPIPVGLLRMHDIPATEAAHEVRRALGFDIDGPLPYLVLAVERLGVTVLGLPIKEPNLDGFCAWRGDSPVIAVLDGVPGDRLRFTVAHELGHLVLHHGSQAGEQVEAEADAFAAELLTPLASVHKDFPRNPTLSALTMLKTQWGVSIKVLIRRARELGILDKDRAVSLFKQISSRGWNRAEPGHVPIEKPRGLRKLTELRYGPGPNVALMAREISWSEELSHDVLDRHATVDELPFITDVIDIHDSASNVVSLSVRRALKREA